MTHLRRGLLLALFATVTLAAAPSPDVLKVREWRAKNERQILAELMQLIALPNQAANRGDIAKNADLLTAMFEKRGFAVNRWETKGSPIVFARRDAANARGSVIFYFHYDGQPSDPKEWTLGAPYAPAAFNGRTAVNLAASSGPVDPNVRIYGRSTADDKGPIVAFLAAIDGLIAAKAGIPWTIKVVLDGEEEAGSRNFDGTMQQRLAEVRSDLAIIVDSPRHASGLPTVYYGSRGGASATITVYGALGDLHSGNYGNFVTDPAMQLSKLIASMKDERGNVVIRNFYDGVAPLTAAERRAIDEIPNVDQKLLEEFGLARQEHPDSRIELQHNRPTLSILGMEAGNVFTGTRSAIPGSASARIEMRLVKGLDTATQLDRLAAHVTAQGFHVVEGEPDQATRRKYPLIARIARGGGGGFPIAKTAIDDPITSKAADAIRALDQRLVQLPTIGGSLPFATFSDTLKLPSIGLAVVNFDNNQHAANENIRVGHFWEAIDIFAALITMTR
jgi:acetylornithine deacetylase/succinyl-diaminopimelate desuccinylase-like protein